MPGLRVLAKSVKARLTNAIGKGDIVERLLAFSRVGSLTVHEEGEWIGLSYITDHDSIKMHIYLAYHHFLTFDPGQSLLIASNSSTL